MEAWVPLFDIFLNSPSPESEASLWFQKSFDPSTTITTSTSSFLTLLSKPTNIINLDSSSSSSSSSTSLPSSSSQSKRIMYIQTLPNATQSRILSFLTMESKIFSSQELSSLAKNLLKGDEEIDFWVKKAAHNLLDKMSNLGSNWISSLSLDSMEETLENEFHSLPTWLQSSTDSSIHSLLPWLPLSYDEVSSSTKVSCFENEDEDEDLVMEVAESDDQGGEEEREVELLNQVENFVDPEDRKRAAFLKTQLLSFETASKTVGLANEIRQFCLDKGEGKNSLVILSMIEPWVADDETASILISHLWSGEDNDVLWPNSILCSIILPRLLVLKEPASRLLVKSTVEFCKLHQSATEKALLFPLIFSKEGINTHICDLITRIFKECLHPAHVSAFCHKVLCDGKEEENARRFLCLPCHQYLISDKLVWTEPLFSLFQNIFNQNIYLTQDSVDHLVSAVRELADRYSKSLKFGNFLLCLVTKYHSLLKPYKLSLTETVERTNTFMTKSILSKLDSL